MPVRRFQIGFATLWPILIALLALPFVEFAAFYWVAARIGVLPALVLLVATSFLGVSLLRRQGGSLTARMAAALRRGETPHGAARESLMVVVGGVLMVIPGFVTDVVGLALMLPSLLRGLRDGPPRPMPEAGPSRRADPNGKVIDLGEGEWRQVGDPPGP